MRGLSPTLSRRGHASRSPSPSYLFRYQPLDDNDPALLWRLRAILEESHLYFLSVEQLNDPHEGSVVTDPSVDIDLLMSVLGLSKTTIAIETPEALNARYESKLKKTLEAAEPRQRRDLVRALVRGRAKRFGVCSFSRHNNSPLMWAHYARGHKGVCLQFERAGLEADMKPHGLLLDVNYSNRIPSMRPDSSDHNVARTCFGTKADVWSYEVESRAIALSGSGLKAFNPSRLKAVIFGARISPENEKGVRSMAGKGPTSPHFLRAKMKADGDEFEMEIKNAPV